MDAFFETLVEPFLEILRPHRVLEVGIGDGPFRQALADSIEGQGGERIVIETLVDLEPCGDPLALILLGEAERIQPAHLEALESRAPESGYPVVLVGGEEPAIVKILLENVRPRLRHVHVPGLGGLNLVYPSKLRTLAPAVYRFLRDLEPRGPLSDHLARLASAAPTPPPRASSPPTGGHPVTESVAAPETVSIDRSGTGELEEDALDALDTDDALGTDTLGTKDTLDAGEPTSYDDVPYLSFPFHETHPDRLRTVARVFGLEAPPLDRARILELGCASGGNLYPIAYQFPNSECIGIDLSRVEIETGREMVDRIGLDNVRLQRASILDVDESWGTFDYIICHGVYSWVPPRVRTRILRILGENLRENGVGYVSYNTYPGWHFKESVREMMRYHARRFKDPRRKVSQAKALLDWLAKWVPTQNTHYSALLKTELDALKRKAGWYVYHEQLEEHNQPVYFHTIMEDAALEGLVYLGESSVTRMTGSGLDPEVEKTLQEIAPDIYHREQYMDFLRNRQFRQTLFCRRGVRIDRNLEQLDPSPFRIASSFVQTGPSGPAPRGTHHFVNPAKTRIATPDPVLRTCLIELKRTWPRGIGFEELYARVKRSLPGMVPTGSRLEMPDAAAMRRRVVHAFLKGILEFRTAEVPVATAPGDTPRASQVARVQASRSNLVTTLIHRVTALSRLERHLLVHLDGTLHRKQLVGVVHEFLRKHTPANDQPPISPLDALDRALARFSREALLHPPDPDRSHQRVVVS